ncbi:MAG: hypothetical protein LBG96_17785 [Tannerella sp.]|jgi:hypothetical protein|nr:hypothetical protein [Tannerella sp.]
MKKNIAITIVSITSVLCSCSANNNLDNENEYDDEILPFRYSISIRGEDGFHGDLLSSDGATARYSTKDQDKSKIDIFNISPENVTQQIYSIEDYGTEFRIVVQNECNTKNGYIESVLELWQLKIACGPNDLRPDVYTYDTIRCEIRMIKDSIVCKSISVNGVITWINDNNGEEPFILLMKEPHDVLVCGLPGPND